MKDLELKDLLNCVKVHKYPEIYLDNNLQVIYIGDNLTEFGYQFELKHIEELLVYFLDIPQHHYFISLEGDWCMCISYENYLDFGFSLNKK